MESDPKKLSGWLTLLDKEGVLHKKNDSDVAAYVGIQAYLATTKSSNLIDILNIISDRLDNPKYSANKLNELLQLLEKNCFSVKVDKIHLIVAGIDAYSLMEEFNEKYNKSLDSLCLLRIFANYTTSLATVALEKTGSEICFSDKYSLLYEDARVQSYIEICTRYIKYALSQANLSAMEQTKIIMEVEKCVNKVCEDINFSEIGSNTAFSEQCKALTQHREQLNSLKAELQKICLTDVVGNALKSDDKQFAPLMLSQNHERIKLAANQYICDQKQDPFTGLCGILNTDRSLKYLKETFAKMFGSSLNDDIIICVFGECRKISKELASQKDIGSQKHSTRRYISQSTKDIAIG